MTEVELGVYCHRWSELQVRLIESIARHTKSRQYAIQVVQKHGNCGVNLNRLWRRFTAPYVVILDEDVAILQDGWLDALIQNLDGDPELGVVGAKDVKTAPELLSDIPEPRACALTERRWIPAYLMAIKRERVASFLRFDEAIPGQMGMHDVDACLQMEEHGLKVRINPSVMVYHPTRDDDETRIREQRPFTRQQQEWYPQQTRYMVQKWGERFTSLK